MVFPQQRFRASLDFVIVAFMDAIGRDHKIHQALRIDRSIVGDGLGALLPEKRLSFHVHASCAAIAIAMTKSVFS